MALPPAQSQSAETPAELPAPRPRTAESGGDRIPELESLRGVMAWLVVLCHLFALSAVSPPLGRYFSILSDGRGAVQVFMILSGFVITHLLTVKREAWTLYLVRRFFRIFPLYAVCLTVAVLLAPWEGEALHRLAANSPDLTRLARDFETGAANPALMLPFKLTMLHGVPPEGWGPLAHSADAYLGPGWSISTEWQFYLLAPLCLAAAQSVGRASVWAAAIAAFTLISHKLDALTSFAFVGRFAHLFFLGAISAKGYHWSLTATPAAAAAAIRWLRWGAAAVVAFLWAVVPQWPIDTWPFTLWAICLWAVMTRRHCPDEPLGSWVRATLGAGPLRFLGRVSYSTYLVHIPILFCLAGWLTRGGRPSVGWGPFVKLAALGVPLILAASQLAYRCVEQPGIEIGRRLARRMSGSRRLNGAV